MVRVVCWYSRGEASRQATKIAIEEHARIYPGSSLEVVRIHIEEELRDDTYDLATEKYFGVPIKTIKDEKYGASVDKVIASTRYMSGPYGARCTKELKKKVRLDYQKYDDVHVFGMTSEESHRVDRLLDSEPEIEIWTPLIDKGLTKADCFDLAKKNSLPLAKMYELGYHNNNCVGCLKASGVGYWNKIREDFPEVFNRRAEQERLLGTALCSLSVKKFEKRWPDHYAAMLADSKEGRVGWVRVGGQLRIPLRYLPPDAGSFKDLDIGSCGFFCEQKDLFRE